MKTSVRVLLMRGAQLVMLRGCDPDDPQRPTWLYTIGGTVEDGEDYYTAAIREVYEETGIQLQRSELRDTGITRTRWRDFARNPYWAQEKYFVAVVADNTPCSMRHWTQREKASTVAIESHSVTALRQLSAQGVEIFPPDVADLAQQVRDDAWPL